MGALKLHIERPFLPDYQKKFLYNPQRFTVIEAATKIGKTFACLWWLFEQAHKEDYPENANFWWVAPVYSQAKIAFNRLRHRLRHTTIYKINESELKITTPRGTVIHFRSAEKPDNLYGEDVYAAVFDEASRARFDAWVALRSTLTKTRGNCKLIGNFRGLSNWLHQLKEKAEEEVLQAQKDLPPKIFAQLYEATEDAGEDMLTTYDAINDIFTNTHVAKGNNETKYITADIALHGSDKFVLFTWKGFEVIEIIEREKCDAPTVEALIKEKAEKFGVRRSNIAYDADGLGSFLRGYLSGAYPFVNNSKPIKEANRKINYNNLKSQCGYHLAAKITAGEIFINCETDKGAIIKELECLRSYGLDKENRLQLLPKKLMKELIGHSPDRLDAMLIRMIFELKKKTRLRVIK